MHDLIIIGGGIAAFSAAIYAGRFQMKTLIIGENFGGTVLLTDEICNYPGFKTISGMDLFNKFKDHAEDYDIETLAARAQSIANQSDSFEVATKSETYKTKTIIFATGTRLRKLNIPGEDEFAGKGVHHCALCDGAFYKDKIIAVAGGSDSAAKEAILLTRYGKKVFIIYRREKIRAEPVTTEQVDRNEKIEIINNTNITQINGDMFVNSVTLDKPYKGSNELKLDALFIQIGQIPVSDLAQSMGINTNDKGEIVIDRNSKTNIDGAFACGDVVEGEFKQVITGAAQGVAAAYSAYEHITS